MHFIIQEVQEEGSSVKTPSRPNHRDHTGAWQRMDSTIDICELDGLIRQAGRGPDSQPKHLKLILQRNFKYFKKLTLDTPRQC